MVNFWAAEAVFVLIQFLLFVPFFCRWKKDCKEISKEKLAVTLRERFFWWVVLFPLWLVPVLWYAEEW